MKITFQERITDIMERKGIKQAELSKLTGITQSSLSDYINGKYQPKQDKIDLIARALNVKPSYLMGWEEKTEIKNLDDFIEIKTKKVPLLGTIACGSPIYAEEEYGEYAQIDEDMNVDFALRCQGDSMINARIYDGDIVFIRKQPTVNNGEIAAVIIDDEATLKRVIIQDNVLILQAENNSYAPITFILSEDESLQDRIRILGKAVAFQSTIR